MSLAEDYLNALEANFYSAVRAERQDLEDAADLIAEALRKGRKAYEWLAGHFIPHETAPDRPGRPGLFTPLKPDQTDRLREGDVLLVSHQYGVLERYVEVAIKAKARGAILIAMCPRSDPEEILRTHPTGTSVVDHADILIDTHIPPGDAAVDAPSGGPGSCPTSATMQALLYWTLTCGVAERMGQ